MRFMAMASVSCASFEIEPNDIAPVANRFTISLAGSTSSIGTGVAGLELEQAAQRAEMPALLVDQVGVFLERREVVLPDGVLHLADGRRIQQMIFAAHAVRVAAAHRQFRIGIRERLERQLVLHGGFAREHIEPDAFNARRGSGEVFVDQRPCSDRWLRTPARRDNSAASRCPSSRRLSAVPC